MNKTKKIIAVLVSVSLLSSCSSNTINEAAAPTDGNSNIELNIKTMSQSSVEYEDDDLYTEWKNENTNYINLSSASAELQGSGAEINENVITINAPGVYVISGKLENGQIVVDSDSDEAVRLVLNNAEINCVDNAPIYVKNSGKTIISLAENTKNVLTDGITYKLDDASTDEPNAVIFCKSDLTINGPGTLTVNANFNNGIAGKDDLKITGGNIQINSVDDGVLGRDLLAVRESNLTISSNGDGLKSTNDTDEEKGNIVLENGSIIITSSSDGIKAENNITILDGKYTINSTDDSIHSNNNIDISGGEFNITTEDDGIHADSTINISGGTINILKSYEGIESSIINISNGNIKLIASDDGLNAAVGKDVSALAKTQQDNFSSTNSNNINISGGTIYIESSGDGIDANGSIYMYGGTVIVNGPTSNNNGAIDYDQKFEIDGGLLIAAGSSGMAQASSETSTQNSVLISYSQIQNADTIVNLSDANGKNIITFSPSKDYQSILMSSPDLKSDSTYTLYTGGSCTGIENNGLYSDGSYENGTKLSDFTISKAVLSISETGEEIINGNFMPGHGGPKNGGMMPDNKNLPEGEMPQEPSNMPPDERRGAAKNPSDTIPDARSGATKNPDDSINENSI